jgi:hypothetical protein
MGPVTNHASPVPAVPECDPPPGPPPDEAALPTNDLGATLLALVMRSISGTTDQATSRIEQANALVERARAEVEAAQQRAQEAEESAGLWGNLREVLGGDIATIASVVAATAVIIGTGGVGAPAVLALAAAGLSATSTVGSRLGLDPKVCALLGTAGALLGVAAGGFGSAGTLATVATGARAVQAGATAASGGAMIVEGDYRGRALHARADQKSAEHAERDARLNIDLAISVLEEAARDLQRARRATSEIQATHDEGQSAVIARIGAA